MTLVCKRMHGLLNESKRVLIYVIALTVKYWQQLNAFILAKYFALVKLDNIVWHASSLIYVIVDMIFATFI